LNTNKYIEQNKPLNFFTAHSFFYSHELGTITSYFALLYVYIFDISTFNNSARQIWSVILLLTISLYLRLWVSTINSVYKHQNILLRSTPIIHLFRAIFFFFFGNIMSMKMSPGLKENSSTWRPSGTLWYTKK
jgi:hypothetical protein